MTRPPYGSGAIIPIPGDCGSWSAGRAGRQRLSVRNLNSHHRGGTPPSAPSPLTCVTVPEQHGKPYSFGGGFFHSGRSDLPANVPGRDSCLLLSVGADPIGRDSLQHLRPSRGGYSRPMGQVCRAHGYRPWTGPDCGAGEPSPDEGIQDDPRWCLADGRRHYTTHPPSQRDLRRFPRQRQDAHPRPEGIQG